MLSVSLNSNQLARDTVFVDHDSRETGVLSQAGVLDIMKARRTGQIWVSCISIFFSRAMATDLIQTGVVYDHLFAKF